MRTKRLYFFVLLFLAFAGMSAQTPADSLTLVSARWDVSSPRDGIVRRCAAFSSLYGGPQYVSLVAVSPEARLRAAIVLSDTLAPVSTIAQAAGAVTAVNGSYFDVRRGNSVCFLQLGGVVKDTTTAGKFRLRVNGAVRIRRGHMDIVPWDRQTEKAYRSSDDILASGPLLLREGRTCSWASCDSSFVHTAHPRSAVAVAADGTVWFVTADGRAPGRAAGMTIPQLAHLIRVLGGRDALNLDGGGSTTLWMDGEVVNHPSDNRRFDHEGERRVPDIICFRP